MAEPAALVDLETLEVSLVGQGANLKRFAIRKGHVVSDIVKAALETEAEGEELVCKGLEGDQAEAVRAAYRALKAVEMCEDVAKRLGLVEAEEKVVEKQLDPEVAAKLEAIEKRNAELSKALEAETARRERAELTKAVESDMAFAPGSVDEKVTLLVKARAAGLGDELALLLSKVSAQLGESELFKSKGANVVGTDARDEMDGRIAKLRTESPKLTYHQAFAQVAKADPALAARWQEESK